MKTKQNVMERSSLTLAGGYTNLNDTQELKF